MKLRLVLLTVVFLVILARAARANPSPGPLDYMFSAYWIIKTVPFNYAVDIVALGAALLVTAQLPGASWKLLPIYNIPVVVVGYVADYLGGSIVEVGGVLPGSVVTSKDPIIGSMLGDVSTFNYSLSEAQGAALLFWTTLFIFAFNLPLIAGILRVNEADSYRRLALAAAVVAVVTTPYFSVNKEVAWTRMVPLLMFATGVGLWMGWRRLAVRRREPAGR
jgi:hypothetical protein